MKIRLVAIDSKMVNHAILKIAQYHINNDDDVAWYDPLFDIDTNILYVSKIFSFTKDIDYIPPNAKIHKGGTGYDKNVKLPNEIENIVDVKDAYKLLYPDIKYSILFTTRGCVRDCAFCLVRQKEGFIHKVKSISLNPNGKHIEILDNNFFSLNDWEERLKYIKKLDQPINFNTGIDVRTLKEKQAKMLGGLKIKRIHIAWDYYKDKVQVLKGIKMLIKYVKPYKITCYVLVGFENKEIVDQDIERVETIWSYGVYPFAMGYINFDNPNHERSKTVKNFQRWCNRFMFKKIEFKDYKQ